MGTCAGCPECFPSSPTPASSAGFRRLAAWTASDAWKGLGNQPTPMMCKGTDGDAPIQNIFEDDLLKNMQLNVNNGKYSELFSVSGVKNGCDISPVSAWAYCMSTTKKLARYGRDTMRWVAKVPVYSYSATFGSIQDYFYFAYKGNLYGVADLDSLPGYPDEHDPDITDLTGLAPIVKKK